MPTTLQTWGRTHRATPRTLHRPVDEAGVQKVVASAAAAGRRVRTFGALHSWSDVALGPDIAMQLDHLSGILEVGKDWVRVAAGTRIRDLNAALDPLGLALPILGSIDHQSIAGAVSTGTHGSSLRHGNLSSGVLEARLVTADGSVLTLRGPDLEAHRVGLGAAGVFTELTLAVVPAFHLHETRTPLPLDEAIDGIEHIAASAEFVKLWWLPHTGMAVAFRADKTSAPSTFSPRGRWLDEKVVNRFGFRAILAAGRRIPRAIPALNRAVGATYFRPGEQVGKSYEVLHLAMPPVHREMEYAIPVRHTAAALRQLRDWVLAERIGVNFVVEVRFVRGDDGWLSPAHGQDVCQLGAYMAQAPDLEAYYAGFEARMLDLEGRPHWGKEFFADSRTIRGRYPRFDDWIEAVSSLDPAGMFRNAFVDRLWNAEE